MKRLLAAGPPRIFQICKCFRGRERGARHLPELTLLEWYSAGIDYLGMMAETEALIRFVASDVLGGNRFTYGGEEIDLSPTWRRMTVHEAFRSLGSLTAEEALREDLFEEILTAEIEPSLGRPNPLFLCDYPASGGALARLKPEDPAIAERFELYIAGIELCNAFSELTDSEEQRRRFRGELSRRAARGEPVYPMPEKFLDALRSMPESAGNALGVDRLVMLFSDSETIDAVVAFPPEAL
jgi:elongation factor P--(R)-beta-lysine ligase